MFGYKYRVVLLNPIHTHTLGVFKTVEEAEEAIEILCYNREEVVIEII